MPEESWAHYQIGIIYQLMGKRKAERKHFELFLEEAEKWVKENPDDANNYISLGVVLTRLGQR